MASFAALQDAAGVHIQVNLDQVRYIQPTPGGSIIFFDSQHTLAITHAPEIIATMDKKTRR